MAHRTPSWISQKIRTIMHEGIRGRKVSQRQAIAVAFAMARAKHKRKIRRKRRK